MIALVIGALATGDWLSIGAIVLLFVLAVVLAIAETAVLRMSRPRAVALADDERRGAKTLLKLLDQPESTINAVTLLALGAQIVTANLLGILLADGLGVWGLVLGLVLNVFVFFVFAEAAPKTWALQHSTRAALAVAPFLYVLTQFWPLRILVRGLLGFVNWILPGKGLKDGPFVTEREIRELADVAVAENEIEADEREMIHSIFEFGDTVVREVMRPRPDIVAVEVDQQVDDAIVRMIDAGFSRLPAYEGETDNIVGLVYLKDLVRRSGQGEGAAVLRDSLRRAEFVPESKRVSDLLQQMRAEKFHMAIVVDEYGDTAGLITMEDLLEEIVGEITDEYDVEEPEIERLSETVVRVPGGTNISELNEALDVDLPDDEWDTVGGLVLNLLGRVPDDGDCVEFAGLEFCSERVENRRVLSVLVTVLPTLDDPGDASVESRLSS
jgi:CBS domain containing-hemolysin-like protein